MTPDDRIKAALPPEPRMMRFWRRMLAYAQERVREEWMELYRHDRCCPHCGTWSALAGGKLARRGRATTHPHLDWHQCDACGQWSLWNEDMLPCPVDPVTLAALPSFEEQRAAALANDTPPPHWRRP